MSLYKLIFFSLINVSKICLEWTRACVLTVKPGIITDDALTFFIEGNEARCSRLQFRSIPGLIHYLEKGSPVSLWSKNPGQESNRLLFVSEQY